jgi:copper homeostasis protein
MQIEVCAYSLESCINAQVAGATRIELCASMPEGGTTPSAGLIRLAKQHCQIPIYVMIRPRGGDFCYSATEIEVMQADILMAKSLNADGVVLGILQPNGEVNIAQTQVLVALAHPMKVTFHRAFDMTPDPFRALEDVIATRCERILTSGQQNKAIDGVALLGQLVSQAKGRIEIMAGSGVSAQNAKTLLATGVQALHLSAKSVKNSLMTFRNPTISMGGTAEVSEYEIVYSDVEKIKAVQETCNH